MGGKGELLKNPKYQKRNLPVQISFPGLCCLVVPCVIVSVIVLVILLSCSCRCCPPPSWSWAWSWCSLSSLSCCFELHLFPPREQLAVVLGAEVVVGLISPLLFPFPRHRPAPCSPPALVFSSVVVVVVVVVVLVVVMVVVLVVVLVVVMVLVFPSSLVVQLEHPQPPRKQMLTVVGQVLGCRSLIPLSLVGFVPAVPHPSLGWCHHSLIEHP